MQPRVLRVETGFSPLSYTQNGWWADILDYAVYTGTPHCWRRLEEKLRLDIILALYARRLASQYDIIWAYSEKVGIPLSFMGLQKPLVVVAHHLESPVKARFVRATGIAKRWAGIGYISNESREFLVNYLGVAPDYLFEVESAKYLDKVTTEEVAFDGPIVSVGVAKRDYNTLISALASLHGYKTELFVSSKFGDKLAGRLRTAVPEWVHFMGYVPEDELVRHYQGSRFVVVPLVDTTQNSAGINVVLEAGACGKAVIATRTGGMSTFVRDGETGILVPPYDTRALRNAIQRLWTQPELAHQMGLSGRRYVEARFNPKAIDADINEFLKKVHKVHKEQVMAFE